MCVYHSFFVSMANPAIFRGCNFSQLEMSTFHVLDSPYFLTDITFAGIVQSRLYTGLLRKLEVDNGFAENLKANLYHKEPVYTLQWSIKLWPPNEALLIPLVELSASLDHQRQPPHR